MKLHDPGTEKELIRIAGEIAGPAGFERPGSAFWSRLLRKALIGIALAYVLAIVVTLTSDGIANGTLRDALFSILLMYLVRMGLDRIAAAFQSACFFATLANLPIRGRTALIHIRGIIFRRFWFIPLIVSFIAATLLHYPINPEKSPETLFTWALLTAIIWATLGIMQVGWVRRLRRVKIWHWATCCVVAYLVVLHLFQVRSILPQEALTAIDRLIGGILWVFPPAWVFPERAEIGGLIPAAIWIVWGAWSWWRWPVKMFPGYDQPLDFLGAFGSVGMAGEHGEKTPELVFTEEPILPEAPPRPPANGWVGRIIAASIPTDGHPVAATLMAATNHSRPVNATMVFAALWLPVIGFGKDLMMGTPYRDFLLLVAWIAPMIVFTLGLLPIGDPLKPALQVCLIGNSRVPVFCMLPVSLRFLLRITLRIVIVRTVIAVSIATPFFWLLAKILGLVDVGTALIAMIPALGMVWILSVPALLSNRLDTYLRRRKGIFPLVFATSLVQMAMGFLWMITGVAGVGFTLVWSYASEMGRHAFLLLPAALACLALSAVMSRLIFESLHLSLRQRRYDWMSKIK